MKNQAEWYYSTVKKQCYADPRELRDYLHVTLLPKELKDLNDQTKLIQL